MSLPKRLVQAEALLFFQILGVILLPCLASTRPRHTFVENLYMSDHPRVLTKQTFETNLVLFAEICDSLC